ncbi:MAG: chemotaxis protein [Gemmatimonadota bacterium]|nr:chemotaxis protein [Gemmatimonadota bacterium]MDH3424955.1 chemotaxis protein [Gemmatimonadota bacterium]
MPNRVAVAVVHGAGVQGPDFAAEVSRELTHQFADELGIDPAEAARELIIEPVHWAPVLQEAQSRLWRKVSAHQDLDSVELRKFTLDFAGDAIAYQPTPQGREVYDSVHAVFAGSLRSLARTAGTKAPLCVIAHSLGTIISSNYLYDLSQRRRRGLVSRAVRDVKKNTPLENGDTLTLFYTMGSPIAVWSLRFEDFGLPIRVPAERLGTHHPGLEGEWVNFYDPDDVVGYPLRPLNAAYARSVSQDRAVNVGGVLTSWNPLSHGGYWADADVIKPIARSLASVWSHINA